METPIVSVSESEIFDQKFLYVLCICLLYTIIHRIGYAFMIHFKTIVYQDRLGTIQNKEDEEDEEDEDDIGRMHYRTKLKNSMG